MATGMAMATANGMAMEIAMAMVMAGTSGHGHGYGCADCSSFPPYKTDEKSARRCVDAFWHAARLRRDVMQNPRNSHIELQRISANSRALLRHTYKTSRGSLIAFPLTNLMKHPRGDG